MPSYPELASPITTPLELTGWIEFNRRRSGLTPIRYAAGPGRQGAMLKAVLFADSRGQVRFAGKPYVTFSLGTPGCLASHHGDWTELVEPIVDDMRRRGVPNAMHLPPEVDDIRPWQWAGFVVGVDYTYYTDLPFEQSAVSRDVRGKCTKAEKAGLRVRRVTDAAGLGDVMACLKETEERGGFRWGLDARLLALALELLGPEHLRISLCSDGSGEAASVAINLHAPGTRAVSWMGATRTAFLTSGATQLVLRECRIDLEQAGATGLDEAGASIRSVAASKARWGGRLVASYHVRTHGARTGARFLSEWKRSRRRQR